MSDPTTVSPATDADATGDAQHPERKRNVLLRIVLALIGTFIFVFGLNMALGGIETLGWEGRSDFFTVTNQSDFDIQDNHVRFVSGVWVAMGLVYLAAAIRWLYELRITLVILNALIFVGGLARLSSWDASLVFGPNIVGSLVAELVLTVLLSIWILRATSER